METRSKLIEIITTIFKIVMNFKKEVADLHKYLIIENDLKTQLGVIIIIIFTLFFVVFIIKKRKKKNIRDYLYFFNIGKLYIKILVGFSIISIIKFLHIFLKMSDIINLIGIIATSILTFLLYKLDKKAWLNEENREINNNFSLPKIGACGFAIIENDKKIAKKLLIHINVNDENEKYMTQYKITNLSIMNSFESNIEFKYCNILYNDNWETFCRIKNEKINIDEFNDAVDFKQGVILDIEIKEDYQKIQELVGTIKKEDSLRVDFILEVKNIFNITSKIKILAILTKSDRIETEIKKMFKLQTVFYNNFSFKKE